MSVQAALLSLLALGAQDHCPIFPCQQFPLLGTLKSGFGQAACASLGPRGRSADPAGPVFWEAHGTFFFLLLIVFSLATLNY